MCEHSPQGENCQCTLTKRRDKLAEEFWRIHRYEHVSPPGQIVIDKYIALQDELALKDSMMKVLP